jgi:hypothetical protein
MDTQYEIRTTNHDLQSTIFVLLAAWLAAPTVQAQPVRALRTSFEREVNRYVWRAGVQWRGAVGGWRIDLRNRFRSDAFLLADRRIDFRDENRLNLTARRSLGSQLAGRVYGRSLWFGPSRVLRQQLLAGLRYAPRPYLHAEPTLGLAWDQRPGINADLDTPAPLRRDIGPAIGVRFGYAPPMLGGYDLALRGESTWRVINPRRGRTTRFRGSAERAFPGVTVEGRTRLTSLRRDAYQSTSFLNRRPGARRSAGTVEATTRDTLRAALEVDAALAEALSWTSQFNLRALRRRTRTLNPPPEALFSNTAYDRRAYDAETALRYRPNASVALARLAVRFGAETDRRELTNRDALPLQRANEISNLLHQADYDEGYLTVSGRGRIPLGSAVRLRARATANILRYDTPEANPDDRDEVYYRGRVGVLWNMSRYLEADLTLHGATYHTVYLNALRSAENNRRRVLRLRPALTWRPAETTRLRLETEARASYTRYDFVLPGRTAQDQAARELRYDLSFRHELSDALLLRADARLSDLRLGRLIENRFAEIPFDTLRTYAGHVRLQAGTDLVAEVGLRFYVRSDYQRRANLTYPSAGDPEQMIRLTRPARQYVVQLGPTCRITWPLPTGHRMRLDGWLNVQRVFYDAYGPLPPADASRIRRAARDSDVTVIPNVTLSVTWDF